MKAAGLTRKIRPTLLPALQHPGAILTPGCYPSSSCRTMDFSTEQAQKKKGLWVTRLGAISYWPSSAGRAVAMHPVQIEERRDKCDVYLTSARMVEADPLPRPVNRVQKLFMWSGGGGSYGWSFARPDTASCHAPFSAFPAKRSESRDARLAQAHMARAQASVACALVLKPEVGQSLKGSASHLRALSRHQALMTEAPMAFSLAEGETQRKRARDGGREKRDQESEGGLTASHLLPS
ncbi:unnamed protein product [Pleuronectes platessa]|uniref:Uncharacterized protein n=1 Tax=Pleuronectes platessa TaxID=8262 RepID=A0A9N7Y9R7_PLEPL|nr:unnamed protein product [Pleuronectes platessa]